MGGGCPKGEKCSTDSYNQNPVELVFLFRFDPFLTIIGGGGSTQEWRLGRWSSVDLSSVPSLPLCVET